MTGSWKTVVAFLDESEGSRRRLDVALALAGRFLAHVVGLYVGLPPKSSDDPSQAMGFARGAGMDDAIERFGRAQDEARAAQRRRLGSIEGEPRPSGEWRSISAEAKLREAAVHCAYADLLVLPPLEGSFDERPWSPVDLVLASGVPGLVIPARSSGGFGAHVLVAWNASRVARRAVGDALPLLAAAERVTVLVVDPSVGMSAHGEEPGADIALFLARHGVSASVDRIASRGASVSDAIAARGRELDADVIVAGAYGHSRFVETVLGSTTRQLLTGSEIPVLISH